MLCQATPFRGFVPAYRNRIYPYLVSRMGDPKPIREMRERVIRFAEGRVLEIGSGAGANFTHYDAARVTKLYALEPNPNMIALAQRERSRTKLDVEYLELPGERIPLEDKSIDSVVSTFTLGTIPDVLTALRGMGRVLRSNGKLIFLELGLSSDASVRRWQKRWDPVAHWLFEGLHLTRDIPLILREGGFRVENLETAYLATFPKSWTFCVYGTAIWREGSHSKSC
jgi:ubiquinone/menaquinone biosynthesis C-methylase UbiE